MLHIWWQDGDLQISRRQRWSIGIGAAVAAVFTILFLRRLNLDELAAQLLAVRLWPLAGSIAAGGVGLLMLGLRLQLLARPIFRLRFGAAMRVILAMLATNNLLPLRLGELVKVVYLSRISGRSYATCLVLTVAERLLDLTLVFAIGITALKVGLFGGEGLEGIAIGALLVLLVILALVVASQAPTRIASWLKLTEAKDHGRRWMRLLGRIGEGLLEGLGSLGGPRQLAALALVTIGYWIMGLLAVTGLLVACSAQIDRVVGALVVTTAASLGALLPAAPGGLGTYHYFASEGLISVGEEPAVAGAVAVVAHLLGSVPYTLVALLVLGVSGVRELVRASAVVDPLAPLGDDVDR